MSVQIPESLEWVLQEDPIAKIDEALGAASKKWRSEQAMDARYALYERIFEMLRSAGEETAAKLRPLDEHDAAGQAAIAEILGVSPNEIATFAQFLGEERTAYIDALGTLQLKEQWEELLPHTPITKIIGGLPTSMGKPFIVFYSADWCGPCKMVKPTFAMLSFFFERADLYYCPDEVLEEREGVEFVPQLIAYFPNGTRVATSCGGSTQDLWNRMNDLIDLGACFKGRRGTLVYEGTTRMIEVACYPEEASSDAAKE